MNVCNLGTNSEEKNSNKKSIIFNGSTVLGGVKPIGIFNFDKILTQSKDIFFKNGKI